MNRDGDLGDVIANLNAALQSYGTLLIFLPAVVGIILAGYAAMKLHEALNSDEQKSYSSKGGYVLAIAISSLLTIASVIIAWFGKLFG